MKLTLVIHGDGNAAFRHTFSEWLLYHYRLPAGYTLREDPNLTVIQAEVETLPKSISRRRRADIAPYAGRNKRA